MNVSGPKPLPANRAAMLVWAGVLASAALLLHIPGQSQNQPAESEIDSQESTPTFRIQIERNLVQVRVVVRDKQGRPVQNLTKDDFRLTDNGKPQVITHFAVEHPRARAPDATPPPIDDPTDEELAERAEPLPDRYIAVYFDDIHSGFGDLVQIRKAAEKYFAANLRAEDRVAVFTSSGRNQLDFTDDQAKVREALGKLQPRPQGYRRADQCPAISDYQGYLIAYQRDSNAMEIATEESLLCDPTLISLAGMVSNAEMRMMAVTHVERSAREAIIGFRTETELALRGLDGVIRQLSVLPGQRTLVMVSPGFLMFTAEGRVERLIERALRSEVIVNALDAKGVFAHIPLGDASMSSGILPGSNVALIGRKSQLAMQRINVAAEIMRSLANDTGGVFVTNNNDFNDGFRKVGALPEVYYTLAYSPQKMKFNGKYHRIKIKLASKAKLAIQARKGYFAPKKSTDPTTREKEEIEQAVFSKADVHELPVAIQTQFFKVSDTEAQLAVLTRLDVGMLQFRKENGRSCNNVTLVTALFDRNGKYLAGKEKRVEFRLLDLTHKYLSEKGLTSKTSFSVIPGTYLIRQIVRDSEGAQLTALSKRVEIPL